MAYYLKGKIQGKYLLTSSFDPKATRGDVPYDQIVRMDYYPVTGIASQINYTSTNTHGQPLRPARMGI